MAAIDVIDGQSAPPLSPGSLRTRVWKRFLRGPDPTLVDELYTPALSEAVRYDRCCAYFSSSVLAAAARGFAGLIRRLIAMGEDAPRPAVRLIVNEELSADDVRALTESGDTSELEKLLARRFKNPQDVLEKQRLQMLGWLAKVGLLEVRVGIMRHGGGIVHGKFGIMTDEGGDAVVFSGSGNETAQGLIANYERLEVSGSWDDPDRYNEYATEFDLLWKDSHPDVHTVTLPEALRLKLIRLAADEPPLNEPTNALVRQRAAMVWKFIMEAPYLSNGGATCDATAMIDLWPHQRNVVNEAADSWPEGRLLCDEVGMGKTIQAILVLRRLLSGRGVRRALLLLPAGLLKQWQAELREKGGLVIPRLEGTTNLVWPDGRSKRVEGLAEALRQDVLLMSRETARTQNNLAYLLAAEPWDLLLLDEAHAARRRKQEEREFNSGNLLLGLLRQLQLRRRVRGILLLSATPMQTHPWEPWDLLSVLGEGGAWLSDFSAVRDYYHVLAAVSTGSCDLGSARKAAVVITADAEFPPMPGEANPCREADQIAHRLVFATPAKRAQLAAWLRRGSPLCRRMHRNTRNTLRRYYDLGLLDAPPPQRRVEDIDFDYADARERDVYNAVTSYIERRFDELERERPGKGFVMTIYRRRASSSPVALERSLRRRREGLLRVIQLRAHDLIILPDDAPELLDADDLPEGDESGAISAALPQNPEVASRELAEIDNLLDDLRQLGPVDSKRDRFFDLLKQVTDDGRPALVFTEYADTMEYLRNELGDYFGDRLACYSGDGGKVRDESGWKTVTKDVITRLLREGKLSVVICTDAASEGLNLQAAGAVVNYDLPWNPSRVEQRIGRIDRIGQKCPRVWVINMFLHDSVDERVYRVLRSRCHLFEHFVGAMQPVLARARRMLLSQETVDLSALDDVAREVEHDPLAGETYVEAEAGATAESQPALSRRAFDVAVNLLTEQLGARVKRRMSGQLVDVALPQFKKTTFAATVEALEANPDARAMTPLDTELAKIPGILWRSGERLPLVIGSHQEGAFRSSVACWVSADGSEPLSSFDDLVHRVEKWDGEYPSVQQLSKAKSRAEREARQEVERRRSLAQMREDKGITNQFAAARLRLQHELGRFLVCVAGSTADLNAVFHEQMTRDIAGARRLRRCYELLDGYPSWTEKQRAELDTFFEGLSENQRHGLLIGSELEAAIQDPRWVAKNGPPA
ncbi:MAG: SNF2-related protein [Planctomycetes bacterium]|nr:SNF2-related protein [Planctomycetota bacterium]